MLCLTAVSDQYILVEYVLYDLKGTRLVLERYLMNNIILNKTEYAKKSIETNDLGDSPFVTLKCVARYYMDCGYNKRATRSMLDGFVIKCGEAPVASVSRMIDNAISLAMKYKAVNVQEIVITDNELKRIDEIKSKQVRRLAFTLLCLSKYWNIVKESDDYWVNSKNKDIMAMANINTSLKRQEALYYELNKLGMVRFSKQVDNTNVQVLYAEEGNPALIIDDFRNLGYQYMMYQGEPYFKCENCGIVTKLLDPNNRRRQKYCKDCAIKIAVQQRVDYVMRKTATRKNEN